MSPWPLGLIVDMDGVLYRGERPMPGLEDFFALIEGRPFVLLTNNSTLSAADCAQKLARMGVTVPVSAILTVSDAVSRYLSSLTFSGDQAFVLGSPALKEAVALAGLHIAREGAKADVVVVGLDRSLSYASLSHAVRLVTEGAAFVTTSLDPVLLTEEGVVPGAGALIAAVCACVDATPVCVGKPSPGIFEMAMSIIGVPARESLVIGDNLAADIAGGAAAGARTALLLGGVTRLDGGGPEDEGRRRGSRGRSGVPRPDFVFCGLADLSAFLRRSWAL